MKEMVPVFALVALGLASIGCTPKIDQPQVVRTAFFHPYGPQISEEEWKDQGSSGETSELMLTGVEMRREYMGGILHGTSSWTFPHSKIVERTEEYEHGKLAATSLNYPSGSPKFREEYGTTGTKFMQAWYEDGSPSLIEEYRGDLLYSGHYYTADGDAESSVAAGSGVKVARNDTGDLLRKDRYDQGILVEQAFFYKNGSLKELVALNGVKRDGESKRFTENGEPISIETWKNGLLDGTQKYFENGRLARQSQYTNGLKQGLEVCFSMDSDSVVKETAFDRDQRHGCCKNYFGDQMIAEWYWNGNKVSEDQFKTWNSSAIASNAAP